MLDFYLCCIESLAADDDVFSAKLKQYQPALSTRHERTLDLLRLWA